MGIQSIVHKHFTYQHGEIEMKPYFAVLAILSFYGCAHQQSQTDTTKTITPPDPVKTDSYQLSTDSPVESKSGNIKTPVPPPTVPAPTANSIKPKKSIKRVAPKTQPIVSKKNNIKKTPALPPISSHVEKAESTAVAVPAEEKQPGFEFKLEQLPLYFGSTWILDRKRDRVSNKTRCLLNSKQQKIDDGYSEAKISLQLTTDSLLIKTSSNIDMSYPDIGIYIDQNTVLPLEKLFGDSSILIEKNTKKITNQLRHAEKLTIKLGFWPTWAKTETRSISFSLINFDKIYQAFMACEKL